MQVAKSLWQQLLSNKTEQGQDLQVNPLVAQGAPQVFWPQQCKLTHCLKQGLPVVSAAAGLEPTFRGSPFKLCLMKRKEANKTTHTQLAFPLPFSFKKSKYIYLYKSKKMDQPTQRRLLFK